MALRTRAGSEVVIYNPAGDGDRPIIGAYKSDGILYPVAWRADGRYKDDGFSSLDLVEDNEDSVS